MEEQLDEIEKGNAGYAETLKDFYTKFKKDLKRAAKEMPNFKEGQPTGIKCDKCGEGEMVEKAGKFGIFLACSRYPDCDNTKEIEAPGDAVDRGARARPARTAAGRWSSSAAASGCSSRAPAIPSARRRGRSSRPNRAWRRRSRIRSSTRSARTAARTSSSSRAASASSRPAPVIPSASTSSRSSPASSARRTAAMSPSGSRAAARCSTAA